MTSSLPQEVREAFSSFVTTELTTIDSRQQPITWPVTPYYAQGGVTIDVSTGLGYPKKANDARRNPHVSLLFSDPTGSGIDSGIRVLVQGTADVDDRDLDANRERYARESTQKLPETADMHPPKPLQRLLGWYYARIYIKVRPERVFVWPDGDHSKPPEIHGARLEEVRSGHAEEEPEAHAEAAGGRIAWDDRIDRLGETYPEAVLSWVAPDGFPLSVRLPVSVDRARQRIDLGGATAALPLLEGRACLTAHRHGPVFNWQENFQVRGDLRREGDRWALVPHRLVGGFQIPKGRAAMMRENFRKSLRFAKTARRELKARKARA